MNRINFLMEIRKLMELTRFQNKFNLVEKTIAQHEWDVARIAYWLAKIDEILLEREVDYKKLLGKSIHHDTIKLYTGDIQSSSENDELKQYIKEVVAPYILDNILGSVIPQEFKEDYFKLVNPQYDNSYEDYIVQIANKLSNLFEAEEEIELGNNAKFGSIYNQQVVNIENIIKSNPNYSLSAYSILKVKDKGLSTIKNDATEESFLLGKKLNAYIKLTSGVHHIERYQNLRKNIKRNVSSHAWMVSNIMYLLALDLENKSKIEINYEKLLLTGLEHDSIEVLVGDILSHIKHMTPEIEDIVEKTELKAYNSIKEIIPNKMRKNYKNVLLDPKDKTVEGDLLVLADMLDVVFETIEEIQFNSNNDIFKNILNQRLVKVEKYIKTKYPEFRDMLKEIRIFLDDNIKI